MKSSKFKVQSSKFSILLILLVSLFGYIFYKSVTSSVFLKKKERVNIVFYGQNTLFYSLGLTDLSYIIVFPTNAEMIVPGGYGDYRVGALGKLVSLEKKPELFRKTFSSATSSFVDLYFYPATPAIYYENKSSLKFFPRWREVLTAKSNSGSLDRLFLLFRLVNIKGGQYKTIEALFDREVFFKKNLGLFYKKTYRNIKDSVQILYTKSYKTAQLLSQMIEGEGIRVVDISPITNYKLQITNFGRCLIIANKHSIVSDDLQKFFGCQFRRGETEVSDIILVLGELEKEWEVE